MAQAMKVGRSQSADIRREFTIANPAQPGCPIDFRHVKVISRDDWNRIQYRIHQREIEADQLKRLKQEKEELRKKSREMIKDWPNTVLSFEGTRQKKLDERDKRLAREEEERVQMDLDEAKYLAEKRRQAIDKAKTQQYYQTDRVKEFHSALRLTEVLKEREAQVELKRLKEFADASKDGYYQKKCQKELEEAMKAEEERLSKRHLDAFENAEFVKLQVREAVACRAKERLEYMAEGENVRRLIMEAALERQRIDQINREEQRRLQKENLQQIADVRRMREIDRLKVEEEEEDCRIFAAAKKKMLKLRLEKERELYDQKQSNLDRIKEKLAAQLKALKDNEEDRIHNAISEKEQKFQDDEADKKRKKEEMLKSIAEHRAEQTRRQNASLHAARQAEQEMLRARREADDILRQNDFEKTVKRLTEARNISEEHLEVARQHQEKQENARKVQLQLADEDRRMLDAEEGIFQDYAHKVIDHCEKGGRNTFALKRAAQSGIGGGLGPQLPGRGGIRPSYKTADGQVVELPNYQRDTTDEVKQTINGDEKTNDRLGFVW